MAAQSAGDRKLKKSTPRLAPGRPQPPTMRFDNRPADRSRGILFDLPHVVAHARNVFTDHGVMDRAQTLGKTGGPGSCWDHAFDLETEPDIRERGRALHTTATLLAARSSLTNSTNRGHCSS